eukprot:TRINITY_DN19747_c0_g1_i1.p1 TRINITY_DN19747_c0_g1~~TRINITY_DN19747_c0_g1_i1.p1  ORF type:complete len:370 (+),score=64.52 TRINITY_DN19747_c0_g1_i1:34-1110(+)
MPLVSSTPQTGEGILRDNANSAVDITSSKPRIELKDLVASPGAYERERELAKLRADHQYNDRTGLLELQVKRPDGTHSQLQLDPKYLVDPAPVPEAQQHHHQARVSPQAGQYPQHHGHSPHHHGHSPHHSGTPPMSNPPRQLVKKQMMEEPHDWSPPRHRETHHNVTQNSRMEMPAAPCGVEEHALNQRLDDIDYELQEKSPEPGKVRALMEEKERILQRIQYITPKKNRPMGLHPSEIPRVTVPAVPVDPRQASNDAQAIWRHFGVRSTHSAGYHIHEQSTHPRGATYPTATYPTSRQVATPHRSPAVGSVKTPVTSGNQPTRRVSDVSSRRRRSSSRRRRSSPDASRRRRRSSSRG